MPRKRHELGAEMEVGTRNYAGKPRLFAGLPNSLGCLCRAGEQFSKVSDMGSIEEIVDLGEI